MNLAYFLILRLFLECTCNYNKFLVFFNHLVYIYIDHNCCKQKQYKLIAIQYRIYVVYVFFTNERH